MPDRYHVKVMPRASGDIVSICAYVEQDSPQNAALVANEILDSIDSLTLFPQRYKVHQHRKDPSKTVRSMPVPPFVVYYRIIERLAAVEVLTVRHGSRRRPGGLG